jgi:hypothetical protein
MRRFLCYNCAGGREQGLVVLASELLRHLSEWLSGVAAVSCALLMVSLVGYSKILRAFQNSGLQEDKKRARFWTRGFAYPAFGFACFFWLAASGFYTLWRRLC